MVGGNLLGKLGAHGFKPGMASLKTSLGEKDVDTSFQSVGGGAVRDMNQLGLDNSLMKSNMLSTPSSKSGYEEFKSSGKNDNIPE